MNIIKHLLVSILEIVLWMIRFISWFKKWHLLVMKHCLIANGKKRNIHAWNSLNPFLPKKAFVSHSMRLIHVTLSAKSKFRLLPMNWNIEMLSTFNFIFDDCKVKQLFPIRNFLKNWFWRWIDTVAFGYEHENSLSIDIIFFLEIQIKCSVIFSSAMFIKMLCSSSNALEDSLHRTITKMYQIQKHFSKLFC